MLKLLPTFLVLLTVFNNADSKQYKCTSMIESHIPEEWRTMIDVCINKMSAQVKEELNAAMTYLAMGAYFSRDTVNRPGFAKFFFESASEEREHAIKFIEYLQMRGELLRGINVFMENLEVCCAPNVKTEWESGVEALTDALNLETKVTVNINDIIKECEGSSKDGNDYHAVDYLTEEFLTEQYKGQRDLAGKIATLGKMVKQHGVLGEFLFDKKLLNGEIF